MLNSFVFGSGKAHIWLHGLLGNCLNLSPLAKVIEVNKNRYLVAAVDTHTRRS